MKRHLRLRSIFAFVCIGALCIGSAQAQEPSRGSTSDNRDERHDHRGHFSFGDRGGSDRGSRGFHSRGDSERRSDDRSNGTGNGSTGSGSTGNSSLSSTSPTTQSPSAAKPAENAAPSLNLREYAKKIVLQYDRNSNMMLEPDEQKELRGPVADSDLNHDGHITIDEIVARLSATQATKSASLAGNSTGTAVTEASGDRDRSGGHGHHHESGPDQVKTDPDKTLEGRVLTGDKRKSYRFSRAADRLPTGLPSWFKSRDTNGDGQVSMSEYSGSWSAGTVSEFRRYDLNDDGFITAKEAAKQK